MLFLIYADGNERRFVKKNIGSHKRRIGEKSGVDILRIFGAFILELRHSGKLAEHSIAVKHPSKLCMCRNVTLNKEKILFGIESACDIYCKGFKRSFAKLCGILTDGYGVHIHNTVDAVIFVFKCTPIFNGTEIIAYCKISRRLNAGKYYFFVI